MEKVGTSPFDSLSEADDLLSKARREMDKLRSQRQTQRGGFCYATARQCEGAVELLYLSLVAVAGRHGDWWTDTEATELASQLLEAIRANVAIIKLCKKLSK
jgi:hypothetical protein